MSCGVVPSLGAVSALRDATTATTGRAATLTWVKCGGTCAMLFLVLLWLVANKVLHIISKMGQYTV